MLIRRLFVAAFLISSPLLNNASGQEPPPSKRHIIRGVAEAADVCPVALAEASYLLTENRGSEPSYEITKETVKITNISGREITHVIIAFCFEGGGGRGRVDVRAGPIAVGETYTLVSRGSSKSSHAFPAERVSDERDRNFFVRVLGVEFADSTHWIKPRTAIDRLWPAIHSQAGPLTIRQCQDLDRAYRATVLLNEDQVVAYRLGVVKDTPDGFAVRLGRWVPLPDAARNKGSNFFIKASDERVSLSQAELFALEKQTAILHDGSQIKAFGGVALFVAEVEFANGTVWRQDLRREELLWGEVRQ